MLVWDWESDDVWIDEMPVAINYVGSWILSDVEYDMLGSLSGYTYRGNDALLADDNGVDINWEAKTAPNDLQLPGKEKNIIKVDTIYRPQVGQQDISFELIRNQGQLAPVAAALDTSIDLTWNSGVKWNSGEKWPGGTEAVVTTFINRNAQTVQARWTGDVNIDLIGYRVHFQVTEP